jgi:hypothetical protein
MKTSHKSDELKKKEKKKKGGFTNRKSGSYENINPYFFTNRVPMDIFVKRLMHIFIDERVLFLWIKQLN